MKYYFDTEFIEGFYKPLFGKRRHFIDLISIGIVCEDGREYYAISNEFNPDDADIWVQDNIISQLPDKRVSIHDSSRRRQESLAWKNNTMIANDVQGFIYGGGVGVTHEFYGYYADYDWVLFCSLFGRMIDLPKGFPMYCKDLKQSLDEKAESMSQIQLTKFLITKGNWETKTELPKSVMDISSFTTFQKIDILKVQDSYPKQENEHNALADAKWNKKLHEFIESI